MHVIQWRADRRECVRVLRLQTALTTQPKAGTITNERDFAGGRGPFFAARCPVAHGPEGEWGLDDVAWPMGYDKVKG